MSYLEYSVKHAPTGLRKVLYLSWPLVIMLSAVAGVGFMILYSVSGGSFTPWAEPQIKRYAISLLLMLGVAMIPIWFLQNMSVLAYVFTLLLLVSVEFFGSAVNGAQRWIDLGFMRLQPSELVKITLIMLLATYYDWLPLKNTSQPLWVIPPLIFILIPAALVMRQPDLGTSVLLVVGGGMMMFLAGVHWGYFAAVLAGCIGLMVSVFLSKGTEWQLLADYQYRRIETFLDSSSDPLGAGYHFTQSKIALGSGGWSGRGFMQGTQTRLNFLPEKHTDFIFSTFAEEFGFIGAITLLALYVLIIAFCISLGLSNQNRFSSLLTLGIACTFFLFFAVNMAMVMGLAPVVGVPLPLVSYGGSAMLALMLGFGLVQSAQVHKPR